MNVTRIAYVCYAKSLVPMNQGPRIIILFAGVDIFDTETGKFFAPTCKVT